MELKPDYIREIGEHALLLIVPYGIETCIPLETV